MVDRVEVARMGAVIADEVNAIKRYASKIKDCAQAGDEQLWHNLDVVADSITTLTAVVRKLEERIAALEATPEEAVEAFTGPSAPAACVCTLSMPMMHSGD
jgi:hypothetical protein